MDEAVSSVDEAAGDRPIIWPPLVGIVWAVIPLVVLAIFGTSNLGVIILYVWCWCIAAPALVLGAGALVVRFRYGDNLAGRWRRLLWYWIGGLYAAAAIPVLAVLL